MSNQEDIGKALGKIPSGVGVVTVKSETEEFAMLASWFQQAGFEAPMILVAVNKKRPIAEAVLSTKTFTLSLFHTNQKDLFRHFARGFELGRNPFEGIKIERKKTGNAILSEAMSYLDCELVNTVESDDHVMCLGRVIDGGILNEGTSMVHLRKNGFHY